MAILSMLQGVAIVDDDGNQFGVLELSITRELVLLLGVVTLSKPPGVRASFPALTVRNDCYPMHAPHAHVRPPRLLKVAVRGGVTVPEGMKPYEIYVGRKRARGGTEPQPTTWAEVEAALGGYQSQLSARRPRSSTYQRRMAPQSPSVCAMAVSASAVGRSTLHPTVRSGSSSSHSKAAAQCQGL